MAFLRRLCRTRLHYRCNWHSLSAFASDQSQTNYWKVIRGRDSQIKSLVVKHEKDESPTVIDWKFWEKSILHQSLVHCLKHFHMEQMHIYTKILKEEHRDAVESEKRGWEFYEEAIDNCKKSVIQCEKLISNGAKSLWVSSQNPPIQNIDTNEWVESDQLWQAYIEKHNLYNPDQLQSDPDHYSEMAKNETNWHSKVNKFNDRSDTPTLYQHVNQLPAWEYYDLHRQAFFEHMTYFLIRTGSEYQYFPECAPLQWLTHIEELRYKWMAVAQRRRRLFQVKNQTLSLSLEFDPTKDGTVGDVEQAVRKILQNEALLFDAMVERLMSNFMFLCHPAIPLVSEEAFIRAINTDNGEGTVYSLGNDVAALFYYPSNATHKNKSVAPAPSKSLFAVMDYLSLTGQAMNPSYVAMLDVFTDILEKRGLYWFNISDEDVTEAFLRRLSPNDASYPVYFEYVTQLKQRWREAQVIQLGDVTRILERKKIMYEEQMRLHKQYCHFNSPEMSSKISEATQQLRQLVNTNNFQASNKFNEFLIFDQSSGFIIRDAYDILKCFKQYDEEVRQYQIGSNIISKNA